MRRSIKGALAAATGAALLLGGAGSLAYWTDAEDVGSAQIESGHVTLSAPDCEDLLPGGTHGWELDGGSPYVAGTTLLVPGDSVTKVCDLTLSLNGTHVGATLGIDAPGFTDNGTSTLDDELGATATFTVGGLPYAPLTVPGTYSVRATITVTFDGPSATNGSQDGDVDLDAIKVTATQTHS